MPHRGLYNMKQQNKAGDCGYQAVKVKRPRPRAESNQFHTGNPFVALPPTTALSTAAGASQEKTTTAHRRARNFRVGTRKHPRCRRKGTPFCRATPPQPAVIRQAHRAPRPSNVWKTAPPAIPQHSSIHLPSNVWQLPAAFEVNTVPVTSSTSTESNALLPSTEDESQVSAVVCAEPHGCHEPANDEHAAREVNTAANSDEVGATFDEDDSLPTLQSSSSSQTLSGRFWNATESDTESSVSEATETLSPYWSTPGPPSSPLEDLDWLQDPTPASARITGTDQTFHSSAVSTMTTAFTQYAITTLGYVCSGPCRDWSDWPDRLGQPGWCSYCQAPAYATFGISKTVTHVT